MDRSSIKSGMFSAKNRSMSAKKSLNTSRKQLSTISHVIYRSQSNVVETFGPALPVLVREALTFSDKNSSASVRLSNDGWVWFVCGRRLLVWPCLGEDSRRRQGTNICRELTLPSSDLAYRADHVTIFSSPGNTVPSCIAASPEGIVRFWPSIAHEGSSVEVNAELQGQECDSITNMGSLGVVLVTTTASVVILLPQVTNGRPSVLVKPLKPPQGWLGGFTRLIPSIIFGSIQSSHGMEAKVVKVAGAQRGSSWLLHVLAGHSLQQWLLNEDEQQTFMYECDINKIAADAFHKTVWEGPTGSSADIQVWLLDLQSVDGGISLLLAATNLQVSSQFFYAFGTILFSSCATSAPTKFDRFCPVKANQVYRESHESDLLSCRALIHGTSGLLYTRHKLFAVSIMNFGDDADVLDVVGVFDEVLGASLCKNVPVIFTKEHGLLSVSPAGGVRSEMNVSVSDVATADSSVVSSQQELLSLSVPDADLEEMETSDNPVLQLQAAFLYYLRKNNDTAERLIFEALPREDDTTVEELAATVVKTSLAITDGFPISDPRWDRLRDRPTLGSTSLQILAQLEDKMKACDAFVRFLKWAHVWEKLQQARDCNVKITLAEHREKLISMYTLKQVHSLPNCGLLLDQCIRHVVGKNVSEGLSAHDIFFCHVSKAHIALQSLVEWSDIAAHSDRRPIEIATNVSTANEILLRGIEAVLEWRTHNVTNYLGSDPPQFEYQPWTAAAGSNGLRDVLNAQHGLTLKYGARATGEPALRTKLYNQLLKISDFLLDGWRAHVRSAQGLSKHAALVQQYETVRVNLIKPFITDGEYELAAVLGEKYLDFHSLVQVCELSDNMERLDAYCNTFSNHNFAQYLFNWYIREGKPGHLLERFRSRAKPSQQEQLSQFLGDHPSLAWLQDVLNHDFISAHTTLESLATSEKELLSRKKTMLSLSKLCLLASEEAEEIIKDKVDDLDAELNLVSLQQDLPSSVLVAHGYDLPKIGVLTPSELIKLFVSDENENASEFDFKKALDLLQYVNDDLERSQLRHLIWCSAILRDTWTAIDPDSPIDSILNVMFFKVVNLLECLGWSLDEVLPPIGSILESEEIGELRNNRQFQYFIRLGYEHFLKNEA